jgi:hypothetical protein
MRKSAGVTEGLARWPRLREDSTLVQGSLAAAIDQRDGVIGAAAVYRSRCSVGVSSSGRVHRSVQGIDGLSRTGCPFAPFSGGASAAGGRLGRLADWGAFPGGVGHCSVLARVGGCPKWLIVAAKASRFARKELGSRSVCLPDVRGLGRWDDQPPADSSEEGRRGAESM